MGKVKRVWERIQDGEFEACAYVEELFLLQMISPSEYERQLQEAKDRTMVDLLLVAFDGKHKKEVLNYCQRIQPQPKGSLEELPLVILRGVSLSRAEKVSQDLQHMGVRCQYR